MYSSITILYNIDSKRNSTINYDYSKHLNQDQDFYPMRKSDLSSYLKQQLKLNFFFAITCRPDSTTPFCFSVSRSSPLSF